MNGQTETVKLALETLAPLHVGSGVELQREMDFVERNGAAFVVDQSRTFAAVAAGDADLDQLLHATRLSDLVGLAGEYHGYALPPLAGDPVAPATLRGCMKDAFFNPYVPGSSLKGAIRTALLASWLRRQPAEDYRHLLPTGVPDRRDSTRTVPSERAQFAAQKLTRSVFGSNPNCDLLRVLHVGDAGFPTAALRLVDIRWLNLIHQGSQLTARWRDMTTKTSGPDWRRANGIYVEALAPDCVVPVVLQWDRFLLSDLQGWHAPAHALDLLPMDFPALCRVLNPHAADQLRREIEFFTTYQVNAPLRQCQDLLAQVEKTQNKEPPEAAYIRLAWGSGWRGMTGDGLAEAEAAAMRVLYKLGRTGMPFPKTRRLAVQGSPCVPLGWVRLMPWRAELAWATPTAPAEPSAGTVWLDRQLAQIQQAHHCQADDALRGQALAQAWQALDDPALKAAALDELRACWQAKGWWDNPSGKAMKKALAVYRGES